MKNPFNYTNEDVEHYVDKKMTREEMLDFESGMLVNSFLADCVEGYKRMKDPPLPPRVKFSRMAMTAIFIGVVCIGAITFLVLKQQDLTVHRTGSGISATTPVISQDTGKQAPHHDNYATVPGKDTGESYAQNVPYVDTSNTKIPQQERTLVKKELNPAPVIGWDNYDSYLNKQANEAIDNDNWDTANTVAKVDLSFLIDKNGKPMNIKVISIEVEKAAPPPKTQFAAAPKTPKQYLKEKAIYVITHGPTWKHGGNGKEVTATVHF